MRLSDIEFPDRDDIRQIAQQEGMDFGILAGSSGAIEALSAAPLSSAILPPLAVAYLKGHINNLFTATDRSIKDRREDWDESTLRDWVFLRASDGILRLINPFVEDDLEELARTDADEFIRVLEACFKEASVSETDSSTLADIERELSYIFTGESDTEDVNHDQVIEELKRLFGVENENEAVRLFLLYRQLIDDFSRGSKHEPCLRNHLREIDKFAGRLVDNLVTLSLENQNFHQLSVDQFNTRTPFEEKQPIESWVYGYTLAEIAARTDDGESYYFRRHIGEGNNPYKRLTTHNSAATSKSDLWGFASPDDATVPDIAEATDESASLGREQFEYFTDFLMHRLRDGENCIVTGRPGMGKSVLCKRIAYRWFDNQIGAVFYRSTSPDQPFTDRAELNHAITSSQDHAGGHVLVVVEDAVRSDASRIFDVMEEYRERQDADVTFLLDSRRTDWDRFVSDHRKYSWLRNRGASYLTEEPVPNITVKTVVDAVKTFNSITDETISLSESKSIFRDLTSKHMFEENPARRFIEGRNNAILPTLDLEDDDSKLYLESTADILVLVNEIISRSSLDVQSPLTRDAANIHSTFLENVQYGGEQAPLRYQLAVLINVLNAAEVELRRSYLYAIASSKQDCLDIDRILNNGELINGVMVRPDTEMTVIHDRRHSNWSVGFMLFAVESNNETYLSAFRDTLHHVLYELGQLVESGQKADLIRGHLQSRADCELSLTKIAPDRVTDDIPEVIKSVFRFGERNPIFYKVYLRTDLEERITKPSRYPDGINEYQRYKLLQIRMSIAREAFSHYEEVTMDDVRHTFNDLITVEVPGSKSAKKEFQIVTQVASREFAQKAFNAHEYNAAAAGFYKFIEISKELGHYLSPSFYSSFSQSAIRTNSLPMEIDLDAVSKYIERRMERDTGSGGKNYPLVRALGDVLFLQGKVTAARERYSTVFEAEPSELTAETKIIMSEATVGDIETLDSVELEIIEDLLSASFAEYREMNKLGSCIVVASHMAKLYALQGNTDKVVHFNDLAIQVAFHLLQDKDSVTEEGFLKTLYLLNTLNQHGKIYEKFDRLTDDVLEQP